MSLANLAANIQGAANQLSGALGLAKSNKTPTYATSQDGTTVPSSFQSEHWIKTSSEFNYGFGVEEVSAGSTLSIDRFVNQIVGGLFKNNEFTDFFLPITPSEITQTEEFAVSIKPTQGGTVVHHSGNKYKTLNISGTTGVHPFKGPDGVDTITQDVLGKDGNKELKYRSGYEVFQHFRAWVKGYHESKKFPMKQNLRMIFRNFKDWEFLYVEPLEFSMKRDATRPLLYNYNIKFKVIGHVPNVTLNPLAGIISTVDKAFQKAGDIANNFSSEVGRLNREVSFKSFHKSMDRLSQATDRATGKAPTLANANNAFLDQLTQRDAKAVLQQVSNILKDIDTLPVIPSEKKPQNAEALSTEIGESSQPTKEDPNKDHKATLAEVLNGLTPEMKALISTGDLPENAKLALDELQKEASRISRTEVENLKALVAKEYAEFADSLNLISEQYNQTFDRTSITTADSGEVTDEDYERLYQYNQALLSIDGTLSSDTLFDTNAQLNSKASSENGADTVGEGIFIPVNENLGTREGILPANTTLEQIAESELGNSARWTEIAELNDLKSPYIVQDVEAGFKVNHKVESQSFFDPTTVQALQIGFKYVVPVNPSPVSSWTGKENYLAEYIGGAQDEEASWLFRLVEEGTTVSVTDSDSYAQFDGFQWSTVDVDAIQPTNVLKPGDTFILPAESTPAAEVKILGPRDNKWTNALTYPEKSLAVDLKLNDDGDLDLLPEGDLNVASGTDNGAQAIVLKLLYSKGSYPNFPTLGTSLTPGGKMPDVSTIRAQVLASLLQDSRIQDVTDVSVNQVGNTINLSFTVFFKQLQNPIPITIPVG